MNKTIDEKNTVDSNVLIAQLEQLKRRFAYVCICIKDIELLNNSPNTLEIIMPENNEYVYTIYDRDDQLSIIHDNICNNGMSMCKFYYTIEKMIGIFIHKLEQNNIPKEQEITVELYGIEQTIRKAFESIINLDYNVVVKNFDPSDWGRLYLQVVQKLAKNNFGHPPKAPRYSYIVKKNRQTTIGG